MHDLLFTKPGAVYPFDTEVRVAWTDDVYSFALITRGNVVTADKCFARNREVVLSAFLVQLVGGEP